MNEIVYCWIVSILAGIVTGALASLAAIVVYDKTMEDWVAVLGLALSFGLATTAGISTMLWLSK